MAPLGMLVYRIDVADRLVSVGPGFDEFAAANEAPGLSAARVLGRRLWSFISDAETVLLYEALVDGVRRTGRAARIPFRCDSPQRRRYMEMEIVPTGEQDIEFRSALLRLEEQAPLPLYDARRPRTDELLRVCGWCKRVWSGGRWLEPEAAIQALDLFSRPALPQLTHGICEDCRERVRAAGRGER